MQLGVKCSSPPEHVRLTSLSDDDITRFGNDDFRGLAELHRTLLSRVLQE